MWKVCVWCVCVLFVHLLEDDLRYLFIPHQVNHGGVQKAPAQVSLYKSHTTEEPLRRHRSGRYCQVLSSHSGQVGKLLLVLFPPHQRVCVVGHLFDFHVRLKLESPFDRGHVEIYACGTHTQDFVQISTMLDLSIRVFHFSLSRLYVKTFQVHGKITEGIVFPGWGEVLVVTEREYSCVWVQQTRHTIESLPVLVQICDPPILHVLHDVLAYRLDTGMCWWHGKFSEDVSSAQPSLLNRSILWKTPHSWVHECQNETASGILITLRLLHNSCDSH